MRQHRLGLGGTVALMALRRAASDPMLVRVQLSWAAVMVGSWTATVSLAVVAYSAGGSGAVALAVIARSVPGMLVGPAVGHLVDRHSRARCMLWAAVACVLATAGAAVVGQVVAAVVVLVTVVALATMVFRTSQSAIMPELVKEPAALTAANVLSSVVESMGVFAGPALAGLLLTVQGPKLAFSFAALLLGVAAALLIGVHSQSPTASPHVTSEKARIGDLFRLRSARLILLLLLAQTTVSGGLVVLYPALAVNALDAGVEAVGLLTSAFGLGGVFASLGLFALAGSSKLGRYTALALFLWALPLLVVPIVPQLPVVLILLAVVGGGNVLFDVTSVTLLQRGVPEQLLGRAFGAVETVVVIGLGIGAVAAPLLEHLLGPARAVAALATPLAVVAVISIRPLRRLDQELTAPTRQVALLRGLAPFALLPALAIERLALRLQRFELAASAVVVRQGDAGNTYYIVDQGTLEVTVDGRVVTELGPRDAFGEVALLRQGRRSATVTARTGVTLWLLEGPMFLASLRADGGRALAAADEVARQHLLRASPRDGS